MGLSLIPKTPSDVRPVANGTLKGAGELRIPLNKDLLTSEHKLNLTVKQTLATAATGVIMPSRIISKIKLETSHGEAINVDGFSFVELTSFVENQGQNRVTLGAATAVSTIQMFLEIHHSNHGALHDFLTALETKISSLDLVLELADPFLTGVFVGGTVTALVPHNLEFSARVTAETFPDMTGKGAVDYINTFDEFGNPLVDDNPFKGVGTMRHVIKSQTKGGTTTGDQEPVRLSVAGKGALRFCQLITIDTATGLPVDNVIDEVYLTGGTHEARKMQFVELQVDNEQRRGVDRLGSGIAVIDFGDDEKQWRNYSDVQEVLLNYRVRDDAPSSYKVIITEDYTSKTPVRVA